jgi:hypothetical protein
MSFKHYFRSFTVALAAALATLALAAPVVPAVPAEQFLGPQNACELWRDTHGTRPARACEERVLASSRSGAPTAEVLPANATGDVATDGGFNWGAAAIGGGSAVGLMAVAAVGVVVLTGRARIRTAR